MTEQTKAQQTLIALKNANKHLTEVLDLVDRKDRVMGSVGDDLRRAASKCGEVKIDIWEVNSQKAITLKQHLTELAIRLEGARS